MVTQRIKEQKVSFVGIITHVKEFVSNFSKLTNLYSQNDSKFGNNTGEKSG